jgi:hypothetical protein
MRAEFVTYAYILLYIALSSGQIFFNKVYLKSHNLYFPGSMFSHRIVLCSFDL